MKHLFAIAALIAAPAFAQTAQQQYAETVRQNNLLQQQGAVIGLSNLQIQKMQQNNAYSNALQQQQRAQQQYSVPRYTAPQYVQPQVYVPQVDYDRVARDLALVLAAQANSSIGRDDCQSQPDLEAYIRCRDSK